MAVSSEDIFFLATELAKQETEVCWRSAVSRAYYCCYHECKVFEEQLPDAPYSSAPKGVHDKFIKQFTTYVGNDDFAKTIRSIGYILGSFKDIRTLADYELAENFEYSRTKEAFQYVNNVRIKLEKLKTLINNK